LELIETIYVYICIERERESCFGANRDHLSVYMHREIEREREIGFEEELCLCFGTLVGLGRQTGLLAKERDMFFCWAKLQRYPLIIGLESI
jgi:hypothetical protein